MDNYWEIKVQKSKEQLVLERNGCVLKSQEPLSNHEIDISKPCYCGRSCLSYG